MTDYFHILIDECVHMCSVMECVYSRKRSPITVQQKNRQYNTYNRRIEKQTHTDDDSDRNIQ